MIPDADLFLRTTADGSLIATETLTALEVGATPHGGLSVEVAVPAAVTGTSPTLDVTVQHSATAGGTFTTFATMNQITDATGALGDGSGVYVLPIETHLPFVRVVLTVAGTTPVFNAVQVYITKEQVRNVLGVGQLATAAP